MHCGHRLPKSAWRFYDSSLYSADGSCRCLQKIYDIPTDVELYAGFICTYNTKTSCFVLVFQILVHLLPPTPHTHASYSIGPRPAWCFIIHNTSPTGGVLWGHSDVTTAAIGCLWKSHHLVRNTTIRQKAIQHYGSNISWTLIEEMKNI